MAGDDKNLIQKLDFQGHEIRRAARDGKWYFAVVDVVFALTKSADPKQYIKRMRSRDADLSANWGTICTPVEMTALDGKKREVSCAEVEGILRIIQSISSPNAEPLKLWLAKVGAERLQELEDPSKALERLIDIYLNQGRTPEWIRERIDGIITRRELTDEWHDRGITSDNHYMILTRMLQKRSIGLGPSEHRKLKGLKPADSLRDHSTEVELLLTRLGEKSTIEIAKARNAKGYEENKEAVEAGGEIAKTARLSLEKQTGAPVASKLNFLPKPKAIPSAPSSSD